MRCVICCRELGGKGRAEGAEKIILNMYENNFTLEQIALATNRSIEEVKAVIKKREPVLA